MISRRQICLTPVRRKFFRPVATAAIPPWRMFAQRIIEGSGYGSFWAAVHDAGRADIRAGWQIARGSRAEKFVSASKPESARGSNAECGKLYHEEPPCH